jgi:hypothetical protein
MPAAWAAEGARISWSLLMKPTDTEYPNVPRLDAQHFENRRNFPADELAKYAGRHIAWNWDGTRVLASGETLDAVEGQLQAQGADPGRVVFDYIIPGDAALIGPVPEWKRVSSLTPSNG